MPEYFFFEKTTLYLSLKLHFSYEIYPEIYSQPFTNTLYKRTRQKCDYDISVLRNQSKRAVGPFKKQYIADMKITLVTLTTTIFRNMSTSRKKGQYFKNDAFRPT
jgi:hypothetical protein